MGGSRRVPGEVGAGTLEPGHDEGFESSDFEGVRDSRFDQARLHPTHHQVIERFGVGFRFDRGEHSARPRFFEGRSQRGRHLAHGTSDFR